MQEYDRLGGDQFLSRYGYKLARARVQLHRNNARYDLLLKFAS